MNISTAWKKVDVTLYRGAINYTDPKPSLSSDTDLAKIPLYVRSVRVDNNLIEQYQYGNPKDWIRRIYMGGTITMDGVMMDTTDKKWLTARFWERIEVGAFQKLQACRPVSQNLRVEDVASGVSVLCGTYVFSFEKLAT